MIFSKHIALAFLFSSLGNHLAAQCVGGSDIFISEYCEGTGNNKAIELFNPTIYPINLEPYTLQRWSNGQPSMTDVTDLIGEIPAMGTWVLVNGQTEDVDLGGGATSPMCSPELQALANQLDDPYPAPTYFNGDDALVLVKNGDVIVDIFGKPGEDPGAAWTDDADNGFIDIGNGSNLLTANHTLRRKSEVSSGVTSPPIIFNANVEWEIHDSDNWSGLGSHTYDCEISGCMIEQACNYSPQSTIHDYTVCDYGCIGCNEIFDFGESAWGYSPNPGEGETFLSGTVGEYYFDSFSITVPVDASAIDPAFDLPLDSMIILGAEAQSLSTLQTVNLTELGLHLNCTQSSSYSGNCTVIGGTEDCFALVGEPLVGGQYEITIMLQAWVTVFGVAVPQPYSTDEISLLIAEEGCADPLACNFSSTVNQDDGSCEYDSCTGCLDELACNFSSTATIETNSICLYPGCLDESATNYDSNAGCEGECLYAVDCDNIGDGFWLETEMGFFPNEFSIIHGIPSELQTVFNIPNTAIEPGSGFPFEVYSAEIAELNNVPEWLDIDLSLTSSSPATQSCVTLSGTPISPGTYNFSVTVITEISVFGSPFEIAPQLFDFAIIVAENENPILGCTYSNATNYIPYATVDDGGCAFSGCTDPAASNFTPLANMDDGSCSDVCAPDTLQTCASDINTDGFVNVSDMLQLLGEFGTECMPPTE